ncbi:hypothetical protein [Brevibacillus brevis]|uniref:hypothetical protein n=1 Tax=Brevibacillus brevis TaxID=1393 RepID=UPI001C8DDCB8|nr:hypothetical protein [Brevibacillus brevis]MBY0088196.1 hypothetical protein [Brevibacillus brevis]
MSFNEKLPEWLAPGTEPPESKKVSGWAPADKPPADYFNWLFHRAYLALKELQEKAAAKLNFDNHVNDNKKHPLYGVTTGTANAYVISFSPQPSGYTDGMEVVLKLHSDSKAGASTININNLGVKSLKKANGNDATNLKANGIYTFRYNATTGNFILQGEGGTGNAIPSDVLVGKTFSNDAGEQTGTMPNHGAKGVIMPTTARQNFGGGYYQAFSVEGDPDLVSGNIVAGKNIFGVNGTAVLRNMNLGNPIWTEKYYWSVTAGYTKFFVPSKDNIYLYMTNGTSVLEKREMTRGILQWSIEMSDGIQDAVVDSKENLWVLTYNKVRKFDSYGNFSDYTAMGGGLHIHIDANDNLYILGSNGKAVSMTSGGGKRREYSTGSSSLFGSALGTDALYVFTDKAYKISLNGSLITSRSIGDARGKGVVTKDGSIYFSNGGSIVKYDKDLLTFTQTYGMEGFRYGSNLVKDANDNLYIADDDTKNLVLIALNKDMSRRATYKIPGVAHSSVIGIEGNGYPILYNNYVIRFFDLSWPTVG